MPQVTSFVGAVASVSGLNATKATNAQWDRVKQALNIVSVLQCVAVCCSGLPMLGETVSNRPLISCVCCSMLQHVAVHCSALQCVAIASNAQWNRVKQAVTIVSVLRCVAVCCGVLRCVAVWCFVLQCADTQSDRVK